MKEVMRWEQGDQDEGSPSIARKISGLPKDGSASGLLRKLSLMQEEELLFLQLPDLLPSQLPLQDFKTKVANKDGQMVVIKQDKAGSQGARECLYPGWPDRVSVISHSSTRQGRGSTSWAKSLWMWWWGQSALSCRTWCPWALETVEWMRWQSWDMQSANLSALPILNLCWITNTSKMSRWRMVMTVPMTAACSKCYVLISVPPRRGLFNPPSPAIVPVCSTPRSSLLQRPWTRHSLPKTCSLTAGGLVPAVFNRLYPPRCRGICSKGQDPPLGNILVLR